MSLARLETYARVTSKPSGWAAGFRAEFASESLFELAMTNVLGNAGLDNWMKSLSTSGAGRIGLNDFRALGKNAALAVDDAIFLATRNEVLIAGQSGGAASSVKTALGLGNSPYSNEFMRKVSVALGNPTSATNLQNSLRRGQADIKGLTVNFGEESKRLQTSHPQLKQAALGIAGVGLILLITDTSPADILKAFTDPIADVFKRFIGAVEGVAETITSPIGSALGTVAIIIGSIIGVVILIVGIVYGVKASKAKTGAS
jgi:hypothetical protein